MMNYQNSNVIQCLRQYDMFANSLNLVKSRDERNMIIAQLTKLEKKILELTNEVYEKEYNELVDKETYLMNEEREKIASLIDLINQRLLYIEKRNNSHYQLTGEVVDVGEVLGSSMLDSLEERINTIDKYQNNLKLSSDLKKEIESLGNKIELAERKISINESLNIELEKKMISILENAFNKLNLYNLIDTKDEYEAAFYEAEKCLNLAKGNLEISKTSPGNMLADCQEMFREANDDYYKYKEKICIIKLIETYNREVTTYDDLMIKRKEINELLKNIKNREFNSLVSDELNKQYETISSEINDIDNYNSLVSDKEDKEAILNEIEEENNSDKFQSILGDLLENEKKRQQKLEEERLRIEEEERLRKQEIERKQQEEILRKQKIIEEARKKEIEKRTREMLKEQQNSIIQNKKTESYSFSTMKEISDENEEKIKKNQIKEEPERENEEIDYEPEIPTRKKVVEEDSVDDFPIFKNKIDIEKELFDEFNNKNKSEEKEEHQEQAEKLPDMSLDDYMSNFKEDNVKEDSLSDLFSEDEFPSIPM